jgi:SAM-dependent methyltransferase
MKSVLLKHRQVWKNKKILRDIYQNWYKKIITDLGSGKTLEIGSGTGNFKEYYPQAISSDIDNQPWLDMHIDAKKLPFKDNSLGNLVLIDTLHHLSRPVEFFKEASRVLKTNGRIILLEPYPAPFSLLIYKLFHPEPFNFKTDYFNLKKSVDKEPWKSNQAIPYLLFYKDSGHLLKINPHLKFVKKELISFAAYPLSGGFENNQLIPDFLFPAVNFAEYLFKPLGRLLAFRCYIVLEKFV